MKPIRKGAVLQNAAAVSHAMLEPGATAHRVVGEPADAAQHVVITAGSGQLEAGGQTLNLSPGKGFTLQPGQAFRLTASGDAWLTAYVITEWPGPAAPAATVALADWQAAPIPAVLQDRRVEITGPIDAKTVIKRGGKYSHLHAALLVVIGAL